MFTNMEKDCKFTIFIEFLTNLSNKSLISQLVKLHINTISNYSEKQLLNFIKSHSSTQYISLLQYLCNLMMIDEKQLSVIEKQKFCTYIYYFHNKLANKVIQ